VSDTKSLLFRSFELGAMHLPNRVVMAPLTRNRAGAGLVPNELTLEYYRQRATAGLIIAEATQIRPDGQGYLDTPGIHSEEQVEAWRKVTDAVHTSGGHIVLQLWHVGRISHVSLQPGGQAPVAPSALRAEAQTFVAEGMVDVSEPRALDLDEIPQLLEDYRKAAANAVRAGFDAVEVHAANGYLLDQFLRDGANRRTDAYGGSIENRARLLNEVMVACCGEIGSHRVGVRLSPVSPVNDLVDSDPQPLFDYVIESLNSLSPLYVHVIEGATGGDREIEPGFDFNALRRAFKGAYIANNGYDKALAEAALEAGDADLIAFGRPFVANPDLVRRYALDAPLNALNPETLYGGGAEGYTDYPALPES
jgi:N-ethylmaleimide reductase